MSSKIKNINIYSDKISKDMKLLVISDIHACKELGTGNLSQIKKKVDMDSIDHIIIPGDIINNTDEIKDLEFRKQLLEELNDLTGNKPTFYSLGNHDQMKRGRRGKYIEGDSELLVEALNELDNFHYLDGTNKETYDSINYGACSPGFFYYETYNPQINKKYMESPEQYNIYFYKNYNPDLFNEDEFNIFLTHEPQSIIKSSKKRGKCIQPNTDVVVSGHMHNGLLPDILGPVMKNRGLISPQMQLFPKYAQGKVEEKDTLYVINGPVNTRVETPVINSIYGGKGTVLTLKKQR